MIDPLVSLAFAVYSSPGTYALLLGSGVSRAANIPTGWEIVSDLARRVAVASGEDAGSDPIVWFREKYGREPDYSTILEELAAEPAERQLLLRPYFEPTEEEREQGVKVPTAAHRAIASLVKSGHIRVIVTTNFDRLLETALADEGVTPTVIATADAAQGALPLAHTDCTIVKIHGDYIDTRIRNTPTELASYEPPLNALLDRVFDEYGLVVSGWSADWDTALRNAFMRTPTRRFTMYWTARSDLSGFAQEVALYRRAVIIRVAEADSLFADLEEKVVSLAKIDAGHPLSSRIAAETLKRYLPEDRHRIRVFDLVSDEAARLEAATNKDRFPVGGIEVTRDSYLQRMEQYEEESGTLIHLLAVGGYWGEEQYHDLWVNTLGRLVNRPTEHAGITVLLDLQRYPAVLALYALGMGAVASGNLGALAAVLGRVQLRENNQQQPLAYAIPAPDVVKEDFLQPVNRPRFYTPASDRLADVVLRQPLRQFLPHEDPYLDVFDKLEYLLSLAYADCAESGWAPTGSFGWRQKRREVSVYTIVEQEARDAGDDWPFLRYGLFGGSLQRFLTITEGYREQVRQLPWF